MSFSLTKPKFPYYVPMVASLFIAGAMTGTMLTVLVRLTSKEEDLLPVSMHIRTLAVSIQGNLNARIY